MMLLYEHPLSSYAQKVKIALREKGLDFKVETPAALGSGKVEGAFAEASPRNEVPALVDGDVRIFDSTIILEYLDDAYPEPATRPKSACWFTSPIARQSGPSSTRPSSAQPRSRIARRPMARAVAIIMWPRSDEARMLPKPK